MMRTLALWGSRGLRIAAVCTAALTLLACNGGGSDPASSGSEPTESAPAEATAIPDATAEADATERPDPLAPYAEHLLQHTFAVGMLRPAALAGELARELDAAAAGALAAPIAGSQDALVGLIGPFEALLRPEGWARHGLDPQRPVALVLTAGPGGALSSTFSELSAKFAAVESVMDLVYAAGEARDAAADAKVGADAEALRAKLDQVGIGVRVIVPVADADQALEALGGLLEGAGFSAAPEPHPSYQASYRDERGVPVLLRKAGDVLVVDAAWFPDLVDTPEAHAAAARLLVDGLEPGKGALPVELDDDVLATLTLDPGDVIRMDYLGAVEDGLDQIAELQALGRGKRSERGNVLLEDFKQLKLTIGMLDEIVRRGPLEAYRITVHTRAQPGAPLRVVSRGLLREPIDASLAATDLSGPALVPEGAFLSASISPQMAAEEGPWTEAGLGAGKWTSPRALFLGARLDQLPGWMAHPAMLGMWLYPMPSAAWRELVPEAIKALEPGSVERIQVALGLAAPGPVLAVVDRGAPPATWQHALACAAAAQPADGTCDDATVAASGTGTVSFGAVPVSTHLLERDGATIAALAATAAGAEALAAAPLGTARGAFEATLDFTALERSTGLHELVAPPAAQLAPWLRKLSLVATLEPQGSVWTLEVDSEVALLLGLHGLADTLPGDLPSLASMISLALGGLYDVPALEVEKPRKRSAPQREAKPVDASKLKAIGAVFDRNKPQVEKCVKRIMQKFGAASGELAVMVYLNDDGSVDKVRVRKDDIGHGLGACVAESIKDWKFAAQGDYVSVGKTWKF